MTKTLEFRNTFENQMFLRIIYVIRESNQNSLAFWETFLQNLNMILTFDLWLLVSQAFSLLFDIFHDNIIESKAIIL